MKSLLPLLLFASVLFTSCESLPQEEVEALVTFREGEITRLNEHTSTLMARVGVLEAQILDIDTKIQTLKEEKAQALIEKTTVQGEIEATQELIEDNQERLEDLLD